MRVDGAPVTATAATYGLSRPSYYKAAAVDRHGLGGLAPAKPGPRRAHKLTDEVIADAQQMCDTDPGIGSARPAEANAEQFAIGSARSVGRALTRIENPKSEDVQ